MPPSALHQQIHEDPTFGYDTWLNPDKVVATTAATATTFSGADTIAGDIGLLPAGLNLYGSYVDNFGGFPLLQARFGKSSAFLISFTIFGNKALCADVEPGAMKNSDLPHWLDTVGLKDAEGNHWVYTNAGNLAAAKAAAGSRKVIWFSAHYGHGPHICGPGTCGFPQAHWTQWDDKGPAGQNFDRSIGTYLPKAPPPPPKPASGLWEFGGTFNPTTNRFTIHGLPGQSVHMAQKKKIVKFTGTVNEHTGTWTIKNAGVIAALKSLLKR